MPSAEETRLYLEIGLQQGLFGEGDAETARAAADSRHPGEVLLERQILSRGQHKGLLRAVEYRLGRDEDKRIAQILIDNHYCQPDQVKQALKRQKQVYAQTGRLVRLGSLLVEEGALTASQHTAAAKLYALSRKGKAR